MKKLFKNKKGFTLMEMLIVVAIIVILVAVSMPVFSSQLTKAKEAADDANIRAAKAVATATYLTADPAITADTTYDYDAANGKLVTAGSIADADAYGKETKHKVVSVTIKTDGSVTADWR